MIKKIICVMWGDFLAFKRVFSKQINDVYLCLYIRNFGKISLKFKPGFSVHNNNCNLCVQVLNSNGYCLVKNRY